MTLGQAGVCRLTSCPCVSAAGPVGPAHPRVWRGQSSASLSGLVKLCVTLFLTRGRGPPILTPMQSMGRMGDGEPTEAARAEGRAPLLGRPLTLITGLPVPSQDGETKRGRAGLPRSPDSWLWGQVAPGPPPTLVPHVPCHPGEGLPEASRSQLACPSPLSSTIPVPAGSLTPFLGPHAGCHQW